MSQTMTKQYYIVRHKNGKIINCGDYTDSEIKKLKWKFKWTFQLTDKETAKKKQRYAEVATMNLPDYYSQVTEQAPSPNQRSEEKKYAMNYAVSPRDRVRSPWTPYKDGY